MKTLLSVAVLLWCTTPVASQIRTFRWTTGSGQCEIAGTYKSGKYNEAELKNTARLYSDFGISILVSVFKYEDIKSLPSIAALDKEYELKSAELKNLKIISSPYWETVRQRKLRELEQVYKLTRVTIQAYENPSALKDYRFADSCVNAYARSLISGGEDLLSTWRHVNEESRKNNCCPEDMRKKFDERYNSPDRFKYALVEVMAFGWFNCANDHIERVDEEVESQNFKKLFIRTRTRCEEP